MINADQYTTKLHLKATLFFFPVFFNSKYIQTDSTLKKRKKEKMNKIIYLKTLTFVLNTHLLRIQQNRKSMIP